MPGEIDPKAIEWRDTDLRADQVLTMIAAICIDRYGELTFTHEEWTALNERYGGQAAVLFSDPNDGKPITVWIDTVGGVMQPTEGTN